MQQQLMTSSRDDWETPKDLFTLLDGIFHFSLDAAASPENALCQRYITEEQNALTTDWHQLLQDSRAMTDTVFLNPPYGAKILTPFMKKVEEEYNKGLTIVTLTAARTETKFFRIIWERARYIIFVYQRLKFELQGQTVGTATFPSVISVFTPHKYNLWPLHAIGHVIEQNVISNSQLYTLP